MSCQDNQGLLDAYLDGELDLAASLEVERHLEHCTGCQSRKARFEQLGQALRQPDLYARAPAGLDNRIRESLHTRDKQATPGLTRGWLTAAAAVAALVICSFLLMRNSLRPAEEDLIKSEVASSHIRSLMANHLTDVLSSDQHTVKPWFNGKLDFTPVVTDLREKGFPLIGGRLDYLDNRPVAALLYKRNQHPINLFEWPAAAVSKPRTDTIRGYNIIHWSQSGMTFWAISDLNARELGDFVHDLEQ